jgi:hypothetical protein
MMMMMKIMIIIIIYLMTVTQGVVAQSPEPEAHDRSG